MHVHTIPKAMKAALRFRRKVTKAKPYVHWTIKKIECLSPQNKIKVYVIGGGLVSFFVLCLVEVSIYFSTAHAEVIIRIIKKMCVWRKVQYVSTWRSWIVKINGWVKKVSFLNKFSKHFDLLIVSIETYMLKRINKRKKDWATSSDNQVF